jgi:hypothetical protein
MQMEATRAQCAINVLQNKTPATPTTPTTTTMPRRCASCAKTLAAHQGGPCGNHIVCGAVYCHKACAARDWTEGGHARICTMGKVPKNKSAKATPLERLGYMGPLQGSIESISVDIRRLLRVAPDATNTRQGAEMVIAYNGVRDHKTREPKYGVGDADYRANYYAVQKTLHAELKKMAAAFMYDLERVRPLVRTADEVADLARAEAVLATLAAEKQERNRARGAERKADNDKRKAWQIEEDYRLAHEAKRDAVIAGTAGATLTQDEILALIGEASASSSLREDPDTPRFAARIINAFYHGEAGAQGGPDAPFIPKLEYSYPHDPKAYLVLFYGLAQVADAQQRADTALAAARVLDPVGYPDDKRPMHPSDAVASVLEKLAATLRADKNAIGIFPTLVSAEGGLANALTYASKNSIIPRREQSTLSDTLVAQI